MRVIVEPTQIGRYFSPNVVRLLLCSRGSPQYAGGKASGCFIKYRQKAPMAGPNPSLPTFVLRMNALKVCETEVVVAGGR